jgi:hypothetical protein
MLTDAQKAEAERLYIFSQLSPNDVEHTQRLEQARREMEAAEEVFAALQNACTHPLAARDYVNRGYTGGWDRDSDAYWTEHRCKLCDKRWRTGQRWRYVGGRKGLPDDTDAKE